MNESDIIKTSKKSISIFGSTEEIFLYICCNIKRNKLYQQCDINYNLQNQLVDTGHTRKGKLNHNPYYSFSFKKLNDSVFTQGKIFNNKCTECQSIIHHKIVFDIDPHFVCL